MTSILNRFEEMILETQAFANAKVFQREEVEGDEDPQTESVYLYEGNPAPDDTPYAGDFRIYPVNVLVKFFQMGEGYHENEDDQHTVRDKRNEYINILMGLPVEWNQSIDPPAYHLDIRSVERIHRPDAKDYHRVLVVFEFHTAGEVT